jgi:hypothetical protein
MLIQLAILAGIGSAVVGFVVLSFFKNGFAKTGLAVLAAIAFVVVSFEVPYHMQAHNEMSGVGAAAMVIVYGVPGAIGWLVGGALSFVIA